ncbi:MAG: peptide deformylase, partial [Rhodocyclaceae bacterium]|nr:peptide deformylase [Rhodocyclaceae bacterium]
EEKNALMVLVNPHILAREGEQEYEEGCLSVPGVYSKISRAARVRVQAQNLDGEPFEIEADGLLAVCLQHEIDHLNGKVFVDYLSQLKQNRIRTKLLKQAREEARA